MADETGYGPTKVVYALNIQKDDKTLSIDDIKDMAEYKELLELGFVLSSSAKEIKNGTFIFSIPNEHIFLKDQVRGSDWYTKLKYYPGSIAFYKRGYIRTIGVYDVWTDKRSYSPVGTYDPRTREGWKDGLTTALRICKKKIANIEKNVGHVMNKEERHEKRGVLVAKKFGF